MDLKKREQCEIIGLCSCEDHGRNPRMFIVEIDNSIPFYDQLLTLAHELVHVKQYATNQLYNYSKKPAYRWRDKVYSEEMYYSRRPWEREAYRKQLKLLSEFAAENAEECWKYFIADPTAF